MFVLVFLFGWPDAVCILANNSRNNCWRSCGIFPYVLVPQSKENIVIKRHALCSGKDYFSWMLLSSSIQLSERDSKLICF